MFDMTIQHTGIVRELVCKSAGFIATIREPKPVYTTGYKPCHHKTIRHKTILLLQSPPVGDGPQGIWSRMLPSRCQRVTWHLELAYSTPLIEDVTFLHEVVWQHMASLQCNAPPRVNGFVRHRQIAFLSTRRVASTRIAIGIGLTRQIRTYAQSTLPSRRGVLFFSFQLDRKKSHTYMLCTFLPNVHCIVALLGVSSHETACVCTLPSLLAYHSACVRDR
ncbi:hypothetical protein F5Y05DRAFT_176061 [Hypoxylon sp. FL0543]|nr:hypothetical protein F5Y05DRAFT_176061 [Hypoxylon sp. FL0543]